MPVQMSPADGRIFSNTAKQIVNISTSSCPWRGLDFTRGDEIQIEPSIETRDRVDVRSQTDIRLEEIPLIKDDPDALAALKILQDKGYSPDQVKEAYEGLQPVPVTKVKVRQAKRLSLDMRVRTEAARILAERSINPEGRELDKNRL